MNKVEELLLEKALFYKESVALYNEKYANCRICDFFDLPILEKKNILEDQRKTPPFGSNIQVDMKNVKRIHRTSGTSSYPLLLTLTDNDLKNIISTGKKAFENVGLSDDDVVVNCMNYCMWMGGFMDHQSLESTGATVIPYGVGHTENLIRLMLDIPGICIHSTPSYLSVLHDVAKKKFGLEPHELKVKKGLFGGEGGIGNEEYRKKLEELWEAEFFDANYGMSEVMSIIASEGKERNGLKFVAGETLYPEIRLLETGETSNANITEGSIGELVLSNLCKESQPLIRYSTGDIVKITNTIQHDIVKEFSFSVIGRSDDMLVVKGINFFPSSIKELILQYAECTGNYQIQVKNEPIVDYVRLVLEPSDKYNIKNDLPIREDIKRAIRDKCFVSCDVCFSKEDIIVRDNKQKILERI